MQYFGIQFTDHDLEVNEVEDAGKKEISGPGKLLGYRTMHKKIREIQGLQIGCGNNVEFSVGSPPRSLCLSWLHQY